MLIVTTTATVSRPAANGDPYEAAVVTVVATGVPAHVSAPTGSDQSTGGDKEVIAAVVYLPSGTDVARTDLITDDTSGITYEVVWRMTRRGLGLDHVQAGLKIVEGAANG